MRWNVWIAVLASIFLLVAPFAFGYNTLSNVATAEAVVLGLLIAGLGLWTALGTEVPAYADYLLMAYGRGRSSRHSCSRPARSTAFVGDAVLC
jgi:hypothetical protein